MEQLIHRAFIAAVAAVTALGILMASAVTTAVANVEPEPASSVERADVSKLTPFNQTRGKDNTAHVRVNKRQFTDFNVTRVDDVTLRVRVTNANRYREKGDTFRNGLVLFDKDGVPLAIWYNSRGVDARWLSATRKTRTDARFIQPKELLDRVAYFTVTSDNKGNSHRVIDQMKDVAVAGLKKGFTELISNGVQMLGAAAGIKNPA